MMHTEWTIFLVFFLFPRFLLLISEEASKESSDAEYESFSLPTF